MKLEIEHTTRFAYDRDVKLGSHLVYLRPRGNPLLEVHRFELECEPRAKVAWMRDDLDNIVASVQFQEQALALRITSRAGVTTSELPPFEFLVSEYARTYPFDYEPLHKSNLGIYLQPPDEHARGAVRRWLNANFSHRPIDTVAWLFQLNRALFARLTYQRRDKPGLQSTVETVRYGSGACRDFAVLLIDMLRGGGLAARFVSGYLYDQNRDGVGGGDMHAWVEVFIPGAGWRGLDPTHGIFCHSGYVPVAHAVVPESVSPVQGSFFSEGQAFAQLSTDVRVASMLRGQPNTSKVAPT